ncbi:MAG: glycosyltransferase family 2 protein [Verrucomicrobiota bacterium]
MASTPADFPDPPPGKNGWPWLRPAASRETNGPLPRISIVTPSFNQAAFLEETIRSVLLQEHPPFEYIVMDGGSRDGSADTIKKYARHLKHWASEPDGGQGDAIDRGMRQVTGDIMAYINSDDFYLPGAFATVARAFADCPEVDWIVGASLLCDERGRAFGINSSPGYSKALFFSGRYLGGHAAWNGKWIPQESVFWRRSLWERAGAKFLCERLQHGDFELWSRFWHYADLHVLPVPLAAYRCHPETYTATRGNQALEPCTRIIESSGLGEFSPGEIRLRDLLCRMGARLLNRFGEPARCLEYDSQASRWRAITRHVM